MDKVTQQNAANVEETASATGNLTQQSDLPNERMAELSRLIAGVTKNAVMDVPWNRPGERRKLCVPARCWA